MKEGKSGSGVSRLMVGQTPAEQKNVSPLMTIVCTRRGKYKLGRTYISLTVLFLDSLAFVFALDCSLDEGRWG